MFYIAFKTDNDIKVNEIFERLEGLNLYDVEINIGQLRLESRISEVPKKDTVMNVPACARLLGCSYTTVYNIFRQPGCPVFYKDKHPTCRSKKYIMKSDLLEYAEKYGWRIKK